jgi:glucokinase
MIYKFLLTNNPTFTRSDDIAKNHYKANIIASYKETDACSKETFEKFARFYGRCARNFALEVLALGGVYIAGGIAAKNPDILQGESFLSEFLKHETMKFLLEKIPIYVVVDYNVSLYGAAKGYFR